MKRPLPLTKTIKNNQLIDFCVGCSDVSVKFWQAEIRQKNIKTKETRTMKKYFLLSLAAALMSLTTVNAAHAVALSWIESNRTVIVDNTVQVSKPNGKWDTQTDHYKDPAPVKWVRHVRDANPQMFLRYSQNVRGKTAHDYAKGVVKNELASRGITVTGIENKVVNNRHVSIINGMKGDERYMVGVWRHRNVGFQLECVAVSDKFGEFMGEFDNAIQSVKILKEQGL